MAKIDWPRVKKKYVTGQMSQAALAKAEGVSCTTLSHRAVKEGWTEQRNTYRNKRAKKAIEAASERAAEADTRTDDIINDLLDKLKEYVSGMDASDVGTYRAVTIALRNIRELRGAKDELDIEEQRARIEKLRADCRRDAKPDAIKLEVVGLPEEYKR